MSKAIRTILSLGISLVLFSALTMAQAGGNNADKDKNKNKQHSSRFSKIAFWRHHKDADKNAKQAQVAPAPSTQPQAKTAQIKPVSAKQVPGKNHPMLPEHHASNTSKPSVKKVPAANKTKPQPKAKDPKTSLKQ